MMKIMVRVRARFFTVGGALFGGVLFAVFALLYAATVTGGIPTVQRAVMWLVFVGLFLYLLDAWTEYMVYADGVVTFDSLLKRKQRFDVDRVEDILLVYEGLNLERGIWSLVFRRRDADEVRCSLGALWHRHVLEDFLRQIEMEIGRRKIVREIR